MPSGGPSSGGGQSGVQRKAYFPHLAEQVARANGVIGKAGGEGETAKSPVASLESSGHSSLTPRPISSMPTQKTEASDSPSKIIARRPMFPNTGAENSERIRAALKQQRLQGTPQATKPAPESDPVARSIERLKERHADVKALTESLNKRIVRFEQWVSQLPGRVETSMSVADPERDPDYKVLLRVRRGNPNWSVEYCYVLGEDYEELKFARLTDAGVRLKAEMIPKLPSLIESMVVSQDLLTQQIASVNIEFDSFAARMGMPPVEGA